MKIKTILISLCFLICFQSSPADVTSLSQIFKIGKGLLDRDGDGLAEKIAIRIFLPDNPHSQELALASDIAARSNLESLVVDFDLVRQESLPDPAAPNSIFILLGTSAKYKLSSARASNQDLPELGNNQGHVSLFSDNGRTFISVAAGSPEALLKTGRAFFLRWPYLWDIWGREEGDTYFSVEEDLADFLAKAGLNFREIAITSASYEFPTFESPHEAIQRLRFDSGEIKNLKVKIEFPDGEQWERAFLAFQELLTIQSRGQKTDVLNYSGCRQMTLELWTGGNSKDCVIHRIGFPKRILTPSYDSPIRPRTSGKDFDLLTLFSTQGFYADRDRDNHADGLETRIIIPEDQYPAGTEKLASRLVLHTTGASFPLVQLDTEIENPEELVSPILIGHSNRFNRELLKTAKLKLHPLEKGWGQVTIVPQAINKSNALVIVGADRAGMENTLSYLSRTFPYLDNYREGERRIDDISSLLEKFLEGEFGTAEAYFSLELENIFADIRNKDFESVALELFLPQKNPAFEESLQERLKKNLRSSDYQFKSFALKDSKDIFVKQKDLGWEKNDALQKILEYTELLERSNSPVRIGVGLSESPEIRKTFQKEIEKILHSKGIQNLEVEVLSAYKQGFFWLVERVMPALEGQEIAHLLIRFAEEVDDLNQPKRFYTEPYRWLQELYPVDEILARETSIPVDKIEFEKKNQLSPTYEALAYDSDNHIVYRDTFSPKTREEFYLKILPEWGKVKLTTGWVTISQGSKKILDTPIKTDMERFWGFYQDEILPEVYSHILKKTGNEPAFNKQPYFKRLLFELWLSEPDYRLELDEEIISSLESIHDEIYFDTLDFLRGITEIELEDESLAEDSSRYSAPGNILPLVHPSQEGQAGRVKVSFEDWQAESPQVILKWKEKGRTEYTKKLIFPSIKPENVRFPSLIFNGQKRNIERLFIEADFSKEKEYTTLIDIIDELRKLQDSGILETPFRFPRLNSLVLSLKFKNLVKSEEFRVLDEIATDKKKTPPSEEGRPITPTDRILAPQESLDIIERLGQSAKIKTYIAGRSYENRQIPVLEIFSPLETYTSLPRLIVFKPTLYFSGRQHANEISATNYILKFAELLAKEEEYGDLIRKLNFVLHPLENPDGAELAYRLQELTPFHSLHAGRYTSLGIDVGNQVGASKPLLPEAKVRGKLYDKWIPDIYLNLHGYPSHEWVQQFSNYSPYLFRDYWIPRGWFVYYRSLSLPLYEKWKQAGFDLKNTIIQEMNADPEIKNSNAKFYDRYYRWAARWQPHMNYLEIDDGLNVYSKRRSSRESRLTSRRQLTFVEETPELMDETARGPWLDFLVKQGLTYLFAHAKYLAGTEFDIVRIEEESQGRVSIEFIRSRPGKLKKGADK